MNYYEWNLARYGHRGDASGPEFGTFEIKTLLAVRVWLESSAGGMGVILANRFYGPPLERIYFKLFYSRTEQYNV